MALDFSPATNPWDVGGKHHQQLPWVQDAKRYGFDHGNEFYTPKSRAQIRDEGLLQLAVLAVVLAAPAVMGAVSGGGAASVVGAATSGQAAGAAVGQGAAATAGSFGTAGIATAAFLQAGALEQITAQARKGRTALNRYFHEVAPLKGQSISHQFEWQPEPLHPSMQLLEKLVKDPVSPQPQQESTQLQNAPVPHAWVHQVAESLRQVVRDPIPAVLMSPMVLQAPGSAKGGPPDFIIDENGKVTPLMRMFMKAAFDFSTESIDETVHRTVEPAWSPGDVTRGLVAAGAFRTGANAITLGVQVIYKDEYWYGNTSMEDWIAIVVHEHTHRQEIERHNDMGWYAAYLVESVTTAYQDLSFERRAYNNEAEVDRFLLKPEGDFFLNVLQNSNMSENDKGFWVTYYALKGIREPHLQKEIKHTKDEIAQTQTSIQTITDNGGTIPDILSSKLDLLKQHLVKIQAKLSQIQAEIQQLNYLGYR